MQEVIGYLREFNFVSAFLRLLIAAVAGGVIGYGRSRQQRAAGLRTYILISLGTCTAMLLALYEYELLTGALASSFEATGKKFDAARIGAQTLSCVGFIGAGIIIKEAHQQVKGLTTSTGLFATVCMGLAAGAGFYECVLLALVLIEIVLNLMSSLEVEFKRKLRNITLSVEFNSVEDIDEIIEVIHAEHAKIYDIDVERSKASRGKLPSAIFYLKLSKEHHSHSSMLSTVAELPYVTSVRELIS